MGKNASISVVVPVYNVEEYIGKSVKSVQSQTYSDIEILLVDDGSTDCSGHICDEMQKSDNRIKVIHKENGGLSDARNAGIDHASGDYIFFLDSDDWVDEDALELLLKTADNENADIVECSYRNVFADHVEEETANTGELIFGDGEFAMQCQLDWRYFKSVAWNKLYRKSIFEDGKRYPKGRYHEDEFFTHQAFYAAEKLVSVDLSKYNYVRERAGSITEKVSSNILDGCYALRQRVDFAKEKQLNQKLIENIENVYCWFIFDRLYRCSRAGIEDDKVNELLKFVRDEKKQVLSWNISRQNKKMYKILCRSYKEMRKRWERH